MNKIHWKWKAVFIFSFALFCFSITTFFVFTGGLDNEISNDERDRRIRELLSTNQQQSINHSTHSNSSVNDRRESTFGLGLWFDQHTGDANSSSNSTDEEKEAEEQQNRATNIDPANLADLLPHLRRKAFRNLTHLNARVLLKATNLVRSPPELLLMIPSTRRKEHNYLLDTLQNLVQNMAEEERHLVQIVVMLAENPWDGRRESKLAQSTEEIRSNFSREINQGLIEVITPPTEWFPPGLEHIQPTLGDSPERMVWRAKQSLDYAFAMMHARVERPNARYYVQLEDDLITVPNFVSELRRFANFHRTFFLIEFSNLGFIGRMFHNNEHLTHMAHFILLLYRSIPVDWVVSNVLYAKFCTLEEAWKPCLKRRMENVVLFRRNPPLFQHVGKHSSLAGKLQKLKEKDFDKNGKIEMERSGNPPAAQFRAAISPMKNATKMGDKLRALYDRFVPFQLKLDDAQKDGNENWLLAIDYGPQTQMQIRGLRIFYTVHFHSSLSILQQQQQQPLPSSFLRVRIVHALGNATIFPDDHPEAISTARDHFLLISERPLRNVSSLQIGLTTEKGGHWRRRMANFTLNAIQVVP